MIPQRKMRPSIAHVSEQLDTRFAASTHNTAPISHNIYLFIGPPENDSFRKNFCFAVVYFFFAA